MPRLDILKQDGERLSLEVPAGVSVMQATVEAGVSGIVGECGGAAMCGTCHVLIEPEWLPRLSPMRRNEDELLDCTAAERRPESRLGCQLRMTDALDGLAIRMPERQQ